MKRILSVILIIGCAFGFITPASAEPLPMYGAPRDLGAPIQTVAAVDAAFGKEDGYNVMYTTVSGNGSVPAVFNVVDLDRQQLLRSFPLPGAASSWAHVKTPDGRVFIGASNKMFVYSPQTKEVTDLGEVIPAAGGGSVWALTSDENGNVYGGTYPKGSLFRIDAKTLQITDMGQVDDGKAPDDDGKPEQYVRSLAYYNGFIYAGTGSSNGRVWKIDPQTGSKVRIELPLPKTRPEYGGKYDAMGFCYGLKVVRHYLFAFFNGPFSMFVYDLDNERWLDAGFTNIRGLVATTGEYDGKVYTAKKDGYLWEIDLETMTEKRFIPFDASLRSSAVLQLQNQPEFPNPTLVTLDYSGRAVLIDSAGKKGYIPSLVEGQAVNIQSMETGPDGKLYMSGYPGGQGAQYDPATGITVQFPLGQAEGMGFFGDTMYFGIYPKAEISAWDTKQPLSSNTGPASVFHVPDDQDRPFVITQGGNKLLIGTIPNYGQLGGSLTIFDPLASQQVSGAVYESYRNIVENQSVVGLVYKDGLIYGSTPVHGGLGIDPIADRAKLFVWDMAAKQKVDEFDLPLEGMDNVPMIGGLTLGTDGLIWGAANGTVFAMDPDTREIVKHINIYPEVTNYGKWRPVYQRWGQNGMLYSNVGGKLTIINPQTLEFRKLADDVLIFTLDNDDNIYFAQGTRLKMLPKATSQLQLNVPAEINVGDVKPYSVKAVVDGALKDVTAEARLAVDPGDVLAVQDGEIKGLKAGTATVTATYSGMSASMQVKVNGLQVALPIKNPSFEEPMNGDQIPGWTSLFSTNESGYFERTGEKSFSGSYSLKVVDSSRDISVAVISDKVEATPGVEYTGKVRMYVESGNPSLLLRFYDENQVQVGEHVTHTANMPKAWTEVEVKGTAPEKAKYAAVFALVTRYNMATVYYDDFQISFNLNVNDSTPPVTSANVEGTMHNGWYNSDVKITLSASDDVSGVARTAYRLDDGAWTNASTPVSITEDGNHSLRFKSTDLVGNEEPEQVLFIPVDRTPPTFTLLMNGAPLTDGAVSKDRANVSFALQASDPLSGVAETRLTVDGTPYVEGQTLNWAGQLGEHRIAVQVADVAGNVAEKTFMIRVTTSFASVANLIETYLQNGELQQPLAAQLGNSLKQAEHQFDLGAKDKAVKHLEDFLRHLNNKAMQKFVSDRAKSVLSSDVEALIQMCSERTGQ